MIYELHVKGFTKRHHGIPDRLRGTYAGLASAPAIELQGRSLALLRHERKRTFSAP